MRLRIAGTAALLLTVVAIGTALFAVAEDDKGRSAENQAAQPVALPAPAETDLKTAAAKARCTLKSYPDYGSEHVTGLVDYKTNPPTSGDHFPEAAADGSYPAAKVPPIERTVHSLEHGRIDLQWRSGTPTRTIGQLQALANEQDGYHVLLFENQTDMPFAVAATAWRRVIGCNDTGPATFDALRAFRAAYVDKGPEFIP